MRQNRPEQQWVPMPLGSATSSEQRKDTIKCPERGLKQERVLLNIVIDLSLQSRLKCNSEQVAAEEAEKYCPCLGVRCSRLTCGNAIDSREGKLVIVVPRQIRRHTTQIKLA
jgi:hypothetical protein